MRIRQLVIPRSREAPARRRPSWQVKEQGERRGTGLCTRRQVGGPTGGIMGTGYGRQSLTAGSQMKAGLIAEGAGAGRGPGGGRCPKSHST